VYADDDNRLVVTAHIMKYHEKEFDRDLRNYLKKEDEK